MRILTIFFITGAALAASAFRKVAVKRNSPEKPNIVLIMADDLGYGDLGCYGQHMIQTPNIDSLAAKGMRLTQYYAGNAVCAPSREALLTGMHTGHTYIRGNFLTDQQEDPAMPAGKVTIAELLKEAGYHTALIGKWGLGGEGHGPETQGFDYSFGYLDQIQAHDYYPHILYENGNRISLPENADGKKGTYSHNLFVEKTLAFLDQPQDKPFFLYLPYTLPHGDHVVPANAPYTDKQWPEELKNYAAQITLLDSDIGRILRTLKTRGMDKNTLILFLSDNGANPAFARFFKSNGNLRGAKTNLYEGGIREPFIAYWPGKIKSAQVSERVSAGWDVLPTICQLTGVKIPQGIDGISFYPTLFSQGRQTDHAYLYWEYYSYNYNWNKPGKDSEKPRNWLDSRAIRFGQWKAVIKSTPTDKDGVVELYDLAADPTESTDQASIHPDLVKQVRSMISTASTNNAPFFPYKQ